MSWTAFPTDLKYVISSASVRPVIRPRTMSPISPVITSSPNKPSLIGPTISPASSSTASFWSTMTRARSTRVASTSLMSVVNEPIPVTCVPGSTSAPSNTGVELLVAAMMISAPVTASSGSSKLTASTPLSSPTRSCADVALRETMRTFVMSLTHRTASSWVLACVPAPKRETVVESLLDRRSAARPPTAPVRRAVSQVPSIRAIGQPVRVSRTTTTAWITGRPDCALPSFTETIFTPAQSCSFKWAGMNRLTP